MDLIKELGELESKGVFIHLSYDHYKDGTNCNFSIEFTKTDNQTYWYGDNHEFGNVPQVLVAAVKLAKWFLEDEDRIKFFFISVAETVTEEGRANWGKWKDMVTQAHTYLRESYEDKDYVKSLNQE